MICLILQFIMRFHCDNLPHVGKYMHHVCSIFLSFYFLLNEIPVSLNHRLYKEVTGCVCVHKIAARFLILLHQSQLQHPNTRNIYQSYTQGILFYICICILINKFLMQYTNKEPLVNFSLKWHLVNRSSGSTTIWETTWKMSGIPVCFYLHMLKFDKCVLSPVLLNLFSG